MTSNEQKAIKYLLRYGDVDRAIELSLGMGENIHPSIIAAVKAAHHCQSLSARERRWRVRWAWLLEKLPGQYFHSRKGLVDCIAMLDGDGSNQDRLIWKRRDLPRLLLADLSTIPGVRLDRRVCGYISAISTAKASLPSTPRIHTVMYDAITDNDSWLNKFKDFSPPKREG